MAITKKQSWWIGIALSIIGTSFFSYQFYIDYVRITTSIPTVSLTFATIVTIGIILFFSLALLFLPRLMIEEDVEDAQA
jgi:hypothetical protein